MKAIYEFEKEFLEEHEIPLLPDYADDVDKMPRLDREFLAGMIWAYQQLEYLDFDPEDDSSLEKIRSEIKAEALEEVRARLIYDMADCVISSLDKMAIEEIAALEVESCASCGIEVE